MAEAPSPSILFVDDDALNRTALAACLRQAGFGTREAATGGDALRLAAETPPDLVILDVNLPDLDGFEVLRRLRADPATAAVPVLHLSGVFVGAHDRARALEGGADGYLTKPADPEEVIATVRALLRVRQAEESARAAARHWQATFDAIHDALFVLDPQGTVVRCNRAAAALVGRGPAGAIGRPCRELLGEAFGPEGAALLEVVAATAAGTPTPEVRVGGRWLRVSADAVPSPLPLSPAGERGRGEGGAGSGGRVLLLADVTARRALEERLRHAEKLEAIGRLAGGVAHEFNNLLTGITGNLSLALQTTAAADPRHGLLKMAETAAWRAAALTRQLLGFARRGDYRPGPVNLNACVADAAGLLRPTLGPHIRLEFACAEGLGQVWADVGGMMQVLMNLCLNARDAMPGGGTVRIETGTPTAEELAAAGRAGHFVRLRVRDTGPGVPPQALAHLFEPFFTTKETGKGTGLGLAVVYGVVQEHGGWVECHNPPGGGACFDVYLPRLDAPSDMIGPGLNAHASQAK